ncbi:MAG: hypothetical protein KC486_31950, partial [Myxococcales bacterium]|nr:hypothetical protein [Myxococcales bacterium]
MGTTTHSFGELAPRSPALRRPPARASERFAALYDAHFDFVWRVLRRQGIYGAATEDAAQEV